MMGEELNAAEVTERGLVGDRRFAVVDACSVRAPADVDGSAASRSDGDGR
jgi:uncharacterized protein YcbX